LLEEMLSDYPGTVLVVSHDRDFLDRVATSILRAEGDGQFVEYAGGYTDMLAQLANRPEMVGISATKTRGPSAPKQLRQRDTSRRKLSFHEQHALDMLPKQIATLEAEMAALHGQLADPNFYARDPDTFAATSARLQHVQTALSTAEDRWLELAALRDELGQV
jgi:ATP-binding cassette subfamily F protein uup